MSSSNTEPDPDPEHAGAFDPRRWAPAFEVLPDAVLIVDRTGQVVWANDEAARVLGWSHEQLVGEVNEPPRRRLVDEDGHDRRFDELRFGGTLRHGEPTVDEIIGLDDGSTTAWFIGSGRALRDDRGSITGAVLTFRSADEVMQRRAIDRATAALAHSLVEAPLGEVDAMTQHHLEVVGRACRADRALFVTFDRAAGRARTTHDWSRNGSPLATIPGGVAIDLMAPLLGYVSRHRPVVLVDRSRLTEPTAAAGRLAAWGLDSAVAAPVMSRDSLDGLLVVGWEDARQPEPAIVDFVVFGADLLAQRFEREQSGSAAAELAAEIQRRDAGGEFGEVLAAEVEDPAIELPDLMAELDDDGRLLAVDQSTRSTLPSLAALVGTSIVELFDPSRRVELEDKLTLLRATGAPQTFTFDWSIQGVDHRFEGRIVRRSDGGAFAVVRDQTVAAELSAQIRAQSDRLARINEQLADVVRARDEFLASVSHELRTPLNAILGMAEMLLSDERSALPTAQKALVGTIEYSGRQLRGLIDDLLELSGLRAGLVMLERARVDVDLLCQRAIDDVAHRAHQRGLDLELITVPDLPPVTGDPARLREVLDRLLDNACKFTEPGGVLGVHASRSVTDEVAIAVWDTGIGMDTGEHERIFEPFTQLDGGLDRLRPGPGLGLAIVAELVELHGGRIEVDSHAGRGSRFTVLLPAG